MHTPSEAELLELWEAGLDRHPIDRSLLLCAWARPDIAPARFADLPLGVVNASLLKLRAALFGARPTLQAVCAHCGEALDIPFAIDALLADTATPENAGEVAVGDYRFRLPASRDLARISGELDLEAAALSLLEACCVARPDGAVLETGLLEEASARLEAADPLADLSLSVRCAGCGGVTEVALDAGMLLWDDLQSRVRAVLAQVHTLAGAYGWTEAEVLALSPRRRAAYLALIGA
jgi:hypothetical protein